MAKLTDKEKKKIVADYIECENYSEVAKMNNRSIETIRNVIKDSKDIREKLRQKKEENTKSIIDYMTYKNKDIQNLLNKLLNCIDERASNLTKKDSLKDMATAYGIIIDKQYKALELQQGYGNNEQLTKVDELLAKINEEARNDIK